MKKSILIATLISSLVFLLSSCSTQSNHGMDDGSNMEGATHEDSKNTDNHMMDNGSAMSWATHKETETKATHGMDDGSTMKWATMDDGTESQ